MIKIATIGTSCITERLLEAAGVSAKVDVAAVYSRDEKRAKQFAEKHNIPKYYSSWEKLLADTEIEGVYVASPNALHCKQTKELLLSGKHVLCEKALASHCREAISMFQTAKEQEKVLLEAIRTIHDPAFDAIKKNLYKVGTVRKVFLEYCQYSSRYDLLKQGQITNIFKKEMSAGALMDIGVYCVHALIDLFGKPDTILADGVILENGIDGAGTILANYPDMTASLSYSKITDSIGYSQIQGENGTLYIKEIANPKELIFVSRKGEREEIELFPVDNTMCYELDVWADYITAKELPMQYEKQSVETMEVLDEARRQMGISFPADVDTQKNVMQNETGALVQDEACTELMERLIQKEWQAFDKVKNVGGRAGCQDDWETFSIMRKSQYMTWTKELLESYLEDFEAAEEAGWNLIAEKYGRMMESTDPAGYEKIAGQLLEIPAEKKQIIEAVVAIQVGWMEECAAHYPKAALRARAIHTAEDSLWSTSYETYLRGEISTYSDKTLLLYGRWIAAYAAEGKNLAEAIIGNSARLYGYASLDALEKRL